MTRTEHICIGFALVVTGMFLAPLSASAKNLDVNGDGMVRLAVLSVPQHPGGVEAEVLCSDLENMFKASKMDVPVRVSFVPLGNNRTLMGWWYNPESQPVRGQLFSGQFDYLLLAETDDIVSGYPEFFFEGVRAVAREANGRGIRVALFVMAKPANSFRDTRAESIAATVYRVGDGCGVEVIPAAFGWQEALKHNRMTGDSPVKARASAFLSAATAYCQLTGERLPKDALEAYWTTKKTTTVLALSARDAVLNEQVRKHYAGPFQGVVRIEPHIKKRLKVYVPNTVEDDPLRQNLQSILDATFQDGFWKTPSDWYLSGFDRYAMSFDLVYGDRQQMEQYLDTTLHTSVSAPPTNRPQPCVAVFCRTPEGDADGLNTLRTLEPMLLESYDYAKSKGLIFVPYPLAWARARYENPKLVKEVVPGRTNDWLTYMLANMLYTLVTDRCQPPSEKEKPHSVNETHPHGYHDTCARIGYETVVQLAALSEPVNTVLLRSETYRIDALNPGFASVRLLNRPDRDVRVFCATDVPGIAALSRESLAFTPDNYDIEQTVRILPATNTPTLFFHFMVSAQSEDNAIDGANDLRPFLLNYDGNGAGELVFATNTVSPATGFQVLLRPVQRPCDMVSAHIVQHGQVSDEIYFGQDHFSGTLVRLYPTGTDFKRGTLPVSVNVSSADQRFNGKRFDFVFRVESIGVPVPTVRVTVPEDGEVIDGPAFVTARAETDVTNGVDSLAVYLGSKRLGRSATPVCSVAVEQGPPQSRLGVGEYTLWAAATTTNRLVVSSAPITFRVRKASGAPNADTP
ncbi:MAG: hypothetical protein PHV28_01655 [Kiritimatiellae bacterium]|nr:hypothetical protein [Kiritimatiellia bacterium]